MQIAICDDDTGCCSQLEKWLYAYGRKENINLQIEVYYTSEKLLEQIEAQDWFDVIFLDIELPEKTGVDIGREIRKYRESTDVSIIYISGKTKYCMDLFELEPLNFHHKPLEREKIIKDMDKISRRCDAGRRVLKYRKGRITKGIFLRDIVYMEANGKQVEVLTSSGERIPIRDSLNQLEREVCKYHFCRSHRSYLVNISYVERYWRRKLTMKNGDVISVGEKYAEGLKNALIAYELAEV